MFRKEETAESRIRAKRGRGAEKVAGARNPFRPLWKEPEAKLGKTPVAEPEGPALPCRKKTQVRGERSKKKGMKLKTL